MTGKAKRGEVAFISEHLKTERDARRQACKKPGSESLRCICYLATKKKKYGKIVKRHNVEDT